MLILWCSLVCSTKLDGKHNLLIPEKDASNKLFARSFQKARIKSVIRINTSYMTKIKINIKMKRFYMDYHPRDGVNLKINCKIATFSSFDNNKHKSCTN